MNTLRIIAVFSGLTVCSATRPPVAWSALPIDLVVATERGAPISAPQEWARTLGRMDLASVKLRGVRSGERPTIEEKRLGQSVRYHLLAILDQRNELRLPDRSFRVGDRQAMKKYFQELPAQAAYNAEERGLFGLTEKQFRKVYAELSQPVGFSTLDITAGELLARIENKLATPIRRPAPSTLRNGKPLTTELQSLTMGTALAFALRRDGLMLSPEQLPGEALRLNIATFDSGQESWPVGWKPAVSSRQSAPHLYELRNIEIDGFTLSQALTALQPALKMPVAMDEWILQRRQIDPAKIQVSHPKKRTFLKSALGKMLSQARLAEEVRVDEKEQPFLWITRFGKDSRPAVR